MEKSLEEIWKEIQGFKNLKPDEQKKELENLGERLRAINLEISANFEVIKKAEGDLASTEAKNEAIQKENTEARERRQNAVALGEDDKKFKVSISDLMAEQDRIEDRYIGLKRRIENLRAEADLLEQEKTDIEKMILRFRLIPLVSEWNKAGQQLAGILKQITVLADQLGEGFYEGRGAARTIFYSKWEGIDCIARLYVANEIDDPKNRHPNGKIKDIFNMRELREELRVEREKAVGAIQKEIEKAAIA